MSGNVIGGRCTFRSGEPYVDGGSIWAWADSTCRKAVVRHSLTVILERKEGTSWVQKNRVSNHLAPALGKTKEVKAPTLCVPGEYRAKVEISVETVKDPGGPDSGSMDSSIVDVYKEHCA
ncbi:hypothetical protein [Streptomyces boluensis]|uniref:Uncharacterized protein n=1 Tax=Streptomyces boluensis TaxID=1775135 RepID=A0A964UNP9_9ACTN|nr:hypothetical protein [Streptomyces boluensis]NBE51987.1 hypothetical protein [Streptomyces boluensis]